MHKIVVVRSMTQTSTARDSVLVTTWYKYNELSHWNFFFTGSFTYDFIVRSQKCYSVGTKFGLALRTYTLRIISKLCLAIFPLHLHFFVRIHFQTLLFLVQDAAVFNQWQNMFIALLIMALFIARCMHVLELLIEGIEQTANFYYHILISMID